jgi:hypothetical protein
VPGRSAETGLCLQHYQNIIRLKDTRYGSISQLLLVYKILPKRMFKPEDQLPAPSKTRLLKKSNKFQTQTGNSNHSCCTLVRRPFTPVHQ